MRRETAGQAGDGRIGRRQARRQALFLLYQWDLTGQPLETLFEDDAAEHQIWKWRPVAARGAA